MVYVQYTRRLLLRIVSDCKDDTEAKLAKCFPEWLLPMFDHDTKKVEDYDVEEVCK